MTRGSKEVKPNASFYDRGPIVLFERFSWGERTAVLDTMRAVLATGTPEWTHGGAYIYWAQPAEGDSGGEVLYAGEADDLARRHDQHLLGGPSKGHKFVDLTAYFVAHSNLVCGLALLVVPPVSLDWRYPPEDPPFLEDGAQKRAGEELEGLLLRASISLYGVMPRFNGRQDAAKGKHDNDGVRFHSLVRFLFDDRNATQDFVTFRMREEEAKAAARMQAEVEWFRKMRQEP